MRTFFEILLQLLVILGLVAANGFFVAAEFALVKMRASQLKPMAKTGGWRVRLALRALDNMDATLSATQLGVTLASLGLGWAGEPFVAHRLEPVLAWCGVTTPATVSAIAFGVAFVVISFLHIVLGELGPKWIALQRPKRITLLAGGPLIVFYYVFFPFIWLLNRAAGSLLGWLGLETAVGEQAPSPEELEHVFSHARHAHPGDALINRLMIRSLR
ncbi:MAG: CNNM domain-containing protein, partial [Verrucomicrobiota bacterium]